MGLRRSLRPGAATGKLDNHAVGLLQAANQGFEYLFGDIWEFFNDFHELVTWVASHGTTAHGDDGSKSRFTGDG